MFHKSRFFLDGGFILKNGIVVNEGKLDVSSKTTKITALWSVVPFVVVFYVTLIIEHENKDVESHFCDHEHLNNL